MAVTLAAAGRNAACNGFVDQLDAGLVKILTAADAVLATITLPNPAFGNSGATVEGRADANAITTVTATGTGTAAKATIHKSDDTLMLTCSVGTSGEDINLDSVSITSGQYVGLDTLTITVPAS